MKNYAFIDGQNLYLGVREDGRKLDFARLRIYLKDKYHIEKAYYYIGYITPENQELYLYLQEVGFILVFKKQSEKLSSQKK